MVNMGLSFLFFIFFFIVVVLFILNIVTSVWAYNDAKQQGKSNEYAIVILLITLFFPLMGLIVYLVIRRS